MTGQRTAKPPTPVNSGTEPANGGQYIPKPRIGRLDTVQAWRREIGKVYRAMRSGAMPSDVGAKLTYVANVAAQLVKFEEELRADRAAIEEFRRRNDLLANGQSTPRAITHAQPGNDLPSESAQVSQ